MKFTPQGVYMYICDVCQLLVLQICDGHTLRIVGIHNSYMAMRICDNERLIILVFMIPGAIWCARCDSNRHRLRRVGRQIRNLKIRISNLKDQEKDF